jgi:hypothetical protein
MGSHSDASCLSPIFSSTSGLYLSKGSCSFIDCLQASYYHIICRLSSYRGARPIITASPTIKPLVEHRFLIIAPVSTTSLLSAKFVWCNEPTAKVNASGKATHSRCHGPLARSRLRTIASRPRPALARKSLDAARIRSLEIGFCYWGTVDDTRQCGTNGCVACPSSFDDMVMISNAIFPSDLFTKC